MERDKRIKGEKVTRENKGKKKGQWGQNKESFVH